MEKATIHDVARLAGVSVSTVSRVVNTPNMVTEGKREAVLQAIRTLGYAPNPIARAMSGKRPGIIGVVVPNIINGTISEMVNGILEELEKSDFNLLLLTSAESERKETQYITLLKEKMINGAIFICSSGSEIDFSPLLDAMPVALVDRFERTPGLTTINADDRMGFKLLTDHLKGLGHTKIGYLAGNPEKVSGWERLNRIRAVMEESNLSLGDEKVAVSDWTLQGGYDACRQLLSRVPDLTALVASSDILALGALAALREMGRRVPEDISVTGFDNFPHSRFSAPPLTTLQYPSYQMGQLAAQHIIKQIFNPTLPARHFSLPVKLLERNSTGGAARNETR